MRYTRTLFILSMIIVIICSVIFHVQAIDEPRRTIFRFSKKSVDQPFILETQFTDDDIPFIYSRHLITNHRKIEVSIAGGALKIALRCAMVYFQPCIEVFINHRLDHICYFNDDEKQHGLLVTLVIDGDRHKIAQGSDMQCFPFRPAAGERSGT